MNFHLKDGLRVNVLAC